MGVRRQAASAIRAVAANVILSALLNLFPAVLFMRFGNMGGTPCPNETWYTSSIFVAEERVFKPARTLYLAMTGL
jgi:hypothetical protein